MNRVYQAIAIAAALGLPLASHAQSSVTGAQVHAEIVAAQQSGDAASSDTSYPEPANYSAAAPHVFHHASDASYGPSTSGNSGSGFKATGARSLAAATPSFDDIYRGH